MFIFALYDGVLPTFTVPGKLENSPTSHIPPQVGHVYIPPPKTQASTVDGKKSQDQPPRMYKTINPF